MCVLLFLSHFPYNIYAQEEGIILTCRNTYLICTVRRTGTDVCSVYVSRLLVDCSLLVFLFQMTSSGAPFWSGPKRCPHPIEFDADNVSGFMSASVSSAAAIFCACPFLCPSASVCFLARFQLLLPVGEDVLRKNHVCCLKTNKKNRKKRNERGKKRKKKKIQRGRERGKKSCKRVEKGSVNVIPD